MGVAAGGGQAEATARRKRRPGGSDGVLSHAAHVDQLPVVFCGANSFRPLRVSCQRARETEALIEFNRLLAAQRSMRLREDSLDAVDGHCF